MSKTSDWFISVNREAAENQLPPLGLSFVRITSLEEALENILAADSLQEAIGVAHDALSNSLAPEDPDA